MCAPEEAAAAAADAAALLLPPAAAAAAATADALLPDAAAAAAAEAAAPSLPGTIILAPNSPVSPLLYSELFKAMLWTGKNIRNAIFAWRLQRNTQCHDVQHELAVT